MSEKFCLRWNDFEANISTAFQELRDDKDFFDVTVACEEEQIQAHKVILSACSPFFRSVLKRNPHQHPLLYLKGVSYRDLMSIVTFMYHGEVNIAQEELNSFLAAAEELRVKGLTQHSGGATQPATQPASQTKERSQERKEERKEEQRPVKRPRPPPPPPPQEEEEEVQEVLHSVKAEPAQATGDYTEEEGGAMVAASTYGEEFEEYGGFEGGQGFGGAGVDPTTDNKGERSSLETNR